jgi:hypothetical protein
MKKQTIGVVCAVVALLAVPTSTLAAEAEALPDPGMTPVSRFYFAETWLQHMNMRLTFNGESRVHKALRYADEKLAEMEAMAEQNREREMERAAEEYRYCLNLTTLNMDANQAGSGNFSGRVATVMSGHISTMIERNAGNDDCCQVRLQAREKAQLCQESAVHQMARHEQEGALRLSLALMEEQCTRLRSYAAGESQGEPVEALPEYKRLLEMSEEIAVRTTGFVNEPEAQQTVQTAIQSHSATLAQIQNELQIGDATPPNSPVQNTVQTQERYGLQNGDAEPMTGSPSGEPNGGTGQGQGGDGAASGQRR